MMKILSKTGYTYNLADDMLTAMGPNNAVTTMTYDTLGRKTA